MKRRKADEERTAQAKGKAEHNINNNSKGVKRACHQENKDKQ